MATYTFQSLGTALNQFTTDVLPENAEAALAAFAKSELQRVIASGEASPFYTRYVNGIADLPEEATEIPNAILYLFSNWTAIITETLEELRKRSPRRSGRFAESFVVIVGNKIATTYDDIPAQAEVWVVNVQPYTRKVETSEGATGGRATLFRSAGRVHGATANVMNNRQGKQPGGAKFTFTSKWLNLPPGINARVPYILKRGGGRKDRQAGQAISYPAVVIRQGGR
ncbi:hypothetical protein [Mesorhizobium sp. CN2-181]|uniref:hypothetical protein n=1 Tax=Mesorhizobium yinganensis TaxID=3157707 RepID=UPI0032B7BEAA